MSSKKILLIEPGYPNKYPPLGLMKLAAYHGPYGRDETVKFVKGSDPEVILEPWDRVYVTTLFSFEWKRTADAIDFAIRAAGGQNERVFVGGIAASLMHDQFLNEPRWAGVRFIKGLLDGPPASALQLSAEEFEFGHEDLHGTPIEELVPDYSIIDQVDYRYPVNDAYFGYASRGCVRKCSFCGVPQLEGAQRDMPPLSNLVNGIKANHGEKKDLVLMDNNVAAAPKYKEVIAEIVDLGFETGATMVRDGNRRVKRRVDFNQGVDARILSKSPMYLKEMSKICISPLRIAFDHIGVRKPYETAVRMAADNQILSLSNYMLYNFMDTPEDLYQRMNVNILLNQELGVRIWSFPMRYQPVNLKDRSHVGKNWNRYHLRSFQIMLQATHGVVSGNPEFFLRAYGQNREEFQHLLSLPHGFLFHRDYFEFGDGRGIREEYEALRNRMTESQERELTALLSGPSATRMPGERRLADMADDQSLDTMVQQALRFHAMHSKYDLAHSDKSQMVAATSTSDGIPLGQDEIVEDAGLFDHEETLKKNGKVIGINEEVTELPTTAVPHLAVGSSILGLVTAGMYDNPLAIYREYIQNAVDALARDRANAEGKIEVTLNPQERTICIRDNGPGLTCEQSQRELIPIGRSSKCLGVDRGFRGVGRLSGLAFASTVTFRTRRRPTDPVTRVIWTGLGSNTQHQWPDRAEDALQHCVTVDAEPGETYPEHFFEAEISGISRHAAGTLLNEDAVRSYISETCPVPMSDQFRFAKDVEDLFDCRAPLTSQVVTINGDSQPIYRQYGEAIRFNDSRTDCFTEFQPFRIPRLEGTGNAAVAWVAHSSYTGSIPKAAAVRGIRARLGNIQIGDESVFDHLFHEDRFNRWCVGEVHILDPHIIPNGRRAYFEPSPHLRNFENHLGPIFRVLATRCRTASSARNKHKKASEEVATLEEAYELATAGYLSGNDATELVQRALAREASIREKVTSTGMLQLYSERLDRIVGQLAEFSVPPPSDWYEGMPNSAVTAYQNVFRALAATARSARPAKETIETILEHAKERNP